MQTARRLLDMHVYLTYVVIGTGNLQAFGSYCLYKVGKQNQNLQVAGHLGK